MATHLDIPSQCLIQNLAFLHRHVDDVLYDLEPWQLWEKFGACFFALRVNAFLLLGHTSVSFLEVCPGAVTRGCNYDVKLGPMCVHTIEEAISAELPNVVTDKDTCRRIPWIVGDDGIRHVLINGTSGTGVDCSSAHWLAHSSDQVLLVLDQRKRVATSLGPAVANALLEKALVIPSSLPMGSKVVRGHFSLLSSFDHQYEQLQEDTFVLSYKQHDNFHGCLAGHPACRSFVDINFDNVSSLRLLTSVKTLATEIIQRRKSKRFETLDEFKQFCTDESCTLSQSDEMRAFIG